MFPGYTNNTEILNTFGTVRPRRLESNDSDLLDTRNFSVTFKSGSNPNLELHVYTTEGTYLQGNHRTLYSIERNYENSDLLSYQYISVDTITELDTLGFQRGTYKVLYNLFENVIGSYDSEKLWIKEISPSRREIRLQLSGNSPRLLSQLQTFKDKWLAFSENDIFDSFVLNFGFNETYQIVNVRFTGSLDFPEIIVKLYEPLPVQFGEKSKLWISEEIIPSVIDNVTIVPKAEPIPVTNLAPPNFDLDEFDGFSISTTFKSWNDLLSENLQTSQQLIDAKFSGSLSGIKLNVNYRNFAEFVHFSSAVERVKNFKYKLELIEYYNSRIRIVSGVNGGDITGNNLTDLFTNRNRVVSGLDDFEKYLFFESSGSKLYTNYDSGTGSIDPWPKVNGDELTWQTVWSTWSTYSSTWLSTGNPDPYGYFGNLSLTTSEEGISYYNDLLEKAQIYDRFNIHALINTIPGHIRDTSEEFSLFVNMIAQHFDFLWSYIKNLTSLKTREEHPKDGMPNDLLYHVAESMGFKLLNGRSTSELWRYSLGTDASGSALQTNNGGISSIPDGDHTKEIWRRIVNNLPYILKTKGTSRSIKALLTCFGIPSTILTIKEYGGPTTFTDLDHFPEYVHDVFHYAWYSPSGSLFIPSQSFLNSAGNTVYPDTLEFRFKTDNNFTYGVNTPYTIFHTSGSSLTLTKETADDNEGTITLSINGKSGSISNLEIFDNSWQQVVINTSNGSGSLRVAKSLYGNTIYLHSASFATGSGQTIFQQNIYFASASNKFNGHFQEIRFWSGSLINSSIEEHASSPSTYTFNVDRYALSTGEEAAAPYNHLLQRFTLSEKRIYSTGSTFYQKSVHPNQSINSGSIYFIGYANTASINFEGFEETYYTPSPSLGATTLFTNKVRIESSSLDPNSRLNINSRIEKSSFDRYSLDSNRIGIYFSPQTAINEDIFNQLGYFEIDDYIGNPGDLYNSRYSDLTSFAKNYWKKYDNRNDFEAYFRALEIYDFTLFKYIKKLLPQRVNVITGLTVEPNVLERSKVKLLNKPDIENLTKTVSIDANLIVQPTGSHVSLVADLGDTSPEIISEFSTDLSSVIDLNFTLESEYETNAGAIENLTNVNRLPNEWSQNRRIGRYVVEESGSYQPIQTLVFNSRTYNTYVDNTNFNEVYWYTGSAANSAETTIIAGNATDNILFTPGPNYIILGTIVTMTPGTTSNTVYIYNAEQTLLSIPSTVTLPYDFSLSGFFGVDPNNVLKIGNSTTGNVVIRNLRVLYSRNADVQSYHIGDNASIGIQNHRYRGSRLTAPGINIDSPNTIDGGPVVRVTQVNPNRIVFSNNQLTTIDQATTGVRRRSI